MLIMPINYEGQAKVVTINNKTKMMSGLLGLNKPRRQNYNEREQLVLDAIFYQKIFEAQADIVNDLHRKLSAVDEYGFSEDALLVDLLKKILCLDPAKRPSPQDILNH